MAAYIHFNPQMIRAILDGKKTVTRRLVKPQPVFRPGETGTPERMDDGSWGFSINEYKNSIYDNPLTPPCYAGDILYVRENWAMACDLLGGKPGPVYMADYSQSELAELKSKHFKWRPSIHMPKWAARIFLCVTDVRLERLQDIKDDPPGPENQFVREGFKYGSDFIAVWENTIPKNDRPLYGWYANPWVWVIEFERTEMPKNFLS